MGARGGKPAALGAAEKDIIARGTFAAVLAAVSGDDKKAGDILRRVAEAMQEEFL